MKFARQDSLDLYDYLEVLKATTKITCDHPQYGKTVLEVSIWSEDEIKEIKEAILTNLKLKTN